MTPQKKGGATKLGLGCTDEDVFFATPTLALPRTKKRPVSTGGKTAQLTFPNGRAHPTSFSRGTAAPSFTLTNPPPPPTPFGKTRAGADTASPLDSANSFFTPPTAKLVKPIASAFMSTGLLSKRNRPKPVEVGTPSLVPDTPCKKTPSRFTFATNTPVRALPFTRPTHDTPVASLTSKKHRIPSMECLKIVKKPHIAPGTPDHQFASPEAQSWSFASEPFPSNTLVKVSQHSPSPFDAPMTFSEPPSDSYPGSDGEGGSGGTAVCPSPYFLSPSLGQSGCRFLDASLDDAFTVYDSGSNRNSIISLTGSPSSISSISTLLSYSTANDSPSQFARTTDWVLGLATPAEPGKDLMICDEDSPMSHRNKNTSPSQQATDVGFLPMSPNHLYMTDYPHFLTTSFFELSHNDPLRLPIGPNSAPMPLYRPSDADLPAMADFFDTQFTLISKLGSGEFSDVYKVQDRVSGCMYAVKKTKFSYTGRKDRLRRLEEVQLMWGLGSHPYCVQLFNAWEQHGRLYLQMELMENGSLDQFLDAYGQHAPLSEDRVWCIFAQVAMALKHLHDHNIVHLDVKPANVFISEDWSLKLGDYGMAAHLPLDGLEGDREGDREYIAPEILSGQYGKPADVFSLGLVLLEMTANIVLPDNGPAWQKLRSGDLSDCQFDSSTSSELVQLISQMVQPLPDDRPTIDMIIEHPCVRKALTLLSK